MQEKKLIRLLAVMLVGLVFGACNSAQGHSQNETRELVVGGYNVSAWITDSSLNMLVYFNGTGELADNLSAENKVLNAEPDDAEANMLAFISQAQELGCIVGSPEQSIANNGDVIGFSVEFICTDERNRLVSTMGELMASPLTVSLE